MVLSIVFGHQRQKAFYEFKATLVNLASSRYVSCIVEPCLVGERETEKRGDVGEMAQ